MGSLLPLDAQILKHITVLLYVTYRLYFWFFSEYGLVASKLLLLFLSFLAILKFIEIVIKKRGEEKRPEKKKKKKKKKKKRPKKKKKKKKWNGCRGGGAHKKKKKKKKKKKNE